MMVKFLKIYILFFAINLCLVFVQPVLSQESKLVSAILSEAGEDLEKLSRLINEHESLLNKYPDGDFASTVMFQLAELHEKKANLVFQKKMQDYENQLSQYDKGELASEPVMPIKSLSQTIDYCYNILKKYPSVSFRDKVLYKLAMSHLQEGNFVKAKDFFEQIIVDFPSSPINLESHFRLGEFYFDKREYKKAIEHYRFLLDHWDNPYFDMALYKLGWAYYIVNDYSNSISTFVYLIKDLNHLERVNSQIISKSKADLRTEAIHYIASCFTEYGGPEHAKSFLKEHKDENYALDVLLKMGELYQKRNFYQHAIKTYEKLLSLYPLYQDAPHIYELIVQNYEYDDQIEQANKARENAITLFGPSGPWAKAYPDGEAHQNGLDLVKNYLLYLGKFYQSQAQETLRARDYQIAASKYQEYLDKFPKAENAAEIHYYFAECAYEQGDFTAAADAYHAIVIKYDSTKYREDAAYNRILCYYQLLGTDKTIDSVTVYIEEFLGTGDILTAKLNKQSQVDILHACNDFVRFFSSSKYSDQVLMKFAETLHELELFYPAVKAYKKVVDLGPSSSYYLSAIMNTGQSLFEGQYYDEAELWLKNLVKNYPDSTRYVNRAKRLIASSQFKIAERKSQSGQSEEAAAILQTIATENNDSQFKERALYAAANEYQKIGKNTQAALAFEELADSHPESELADEALYQAATLRENNQEWTLAAANYVKLEENFPESNYAAQSLKNAALCYENQKEWFAAKKLYTKFTNKYSHETQDMIECLFKSGEMAYKTNTFDQALSSFHQTIDFYRSEISNGKLLDNYFVANAQFMIGEIYFQDYQTLDLKPPLKQNLRRKIDKLNLVLNNYKETLEYQVADWSTAASYKIGRAFEELVRAFMESPPPPGLEQQQVKLYTEKLEQSAIPHKESALKAYIQNIKKAKQNQIENVWIAQSRERMQILMDELGYNEKTKSALEKSGASDS